MTQPAPFSPTPGSPRGLRPVQVGIPPTRGERDELHRAIERYVADSRPVPPLSFEELHQHTRNVLKLTGLPEACAPYAAILLSNEVWKDALAAVPFDRRLLLLPQCLRRRDVCRARVDEYGLLCAHCGQCVLDGLITAAERLGYAVLVAEGMTVVIELIRSGRVQAVVGVSCLSGLQKVYPLMEAAAVPAVALPLLQDGCADTSADMDRVWDVVQRHDPAGKGLDLDALHQRVEAWFTPAGLAEVLGPPGTETERIAQDWLAVAGKRWRPMLTACAHAALAGRTAADLPPEIRDLAVAVECFHKASLVHDDIEDADPQRYGQQTLHERHGVPVALNVGDLLLGEGYRLIGRCPVGAELRAGLLRAAAAGHRDLCLGQGRELCWLRDPRPLGAQEVVDIFRLKTAPAFAVALRLGAMCAGAGQELCQALERYSEHLGVAYQISDDLADYEGHDGREASAPRPSILYCLAHEACQGADRGAMASAWCPCPPAAPQADTLRRLVRDRGAEAKARQMLRHHVAEAVEALRAVRSAPLKRLLRQVLGRIFCDAQAAELREAIAGGLPGFGGVEPGVGAPG